MKSKIFTLQLKRSDESIKFIRIIIISCESLSKIPRKWFYLRIELKKLIFRKFFFLNMDHFVHDFFYPFFTVSVKTLKRKKQKVNVNNEASCEK